MCFFWVTFTLTFTHTVSPLLVSEILACPGYWSGHLLLSHFRIHCHWTRVTISKAFSHKDSSRCVHASPREQNHSKVTLTPPLHGPQLPPLRPFQLSSHSPSHASPLHPPPCLQSSVINISCSSTPGWFLSVPRPLHLARPPSSLLQCFARWVLTSTAAPCGVGTLLQWRTEYIYHNKWWW